MAHFLRGLVSVSSAVYGVLEVFIHRVILVFFYMYFKSFLGGSLGFMVCQQMFFREACYVLYYFLKHAYHLVRWAGDRPLTETRAERKVFDDRLN